MAKMYDVAVVGAGPAGSTVAGALARQGFSTIILERKRTVGVPVQCGELLPTPAEMRELFPRAKRAPRLVDVPSRLITNSTSVIRLISPRNSIFEFGFAANIIDRTHFDQWLAENAMDSGAELCLQTNLLSRKSSSELEAKGPSGRQTIRAKVIVGADGPRSIISRSIGNKYSNLGRDMSASAQYVMDGVEADSDVVEMYFGSTVAPGGYLWNIPKGEGSANIGLGLREQYKASGVAPRTYLEQVVKKHKIVSILTQRATIRSRVGAFIPVGGPVAKTFGSQTVLVGDAAGHVMACNGGGIPSAMVGGEIASEIVANNLEFGEALSKYEPKWRSEMGQELGTALSILRIADRVMTSDSLTDQCMRLAGARFLEPLIKCRLPLLVDLASKTFVRVLENLE
ncbi:MAG: geranylgeranyl reductase family protein [Promethearchaeota archaeon]